MISKFSEENATFSARFKNFSKDEGQFINIVQKKFNTKHCDVDVQAMDLINELDRLIYHQDEPFQTETFMLNIEFTKKQKRWA